jgi:hypothetical protein
MNLNEGSFKIQFEFLSKQNPWGTFFVTTSPGHCPGRSPVLKINKETCNLRQQVEEAAKPANQREMDELVVSKNLELACQPPGVLSKKGQSHESREVPSKEDRIVWLSTFCYF